MVRIWSQASEMSPPHRLASGLPPFKKASQVTSPNSGTTRPRNHSTNSAYMRSARSWVNSLSLPLPRYNPRAQQPPVRMPQQEPHWPRPLHKPAAARTAKVSSRPWASRASMTRIWLQQ
jgi:hypothetical protein